MPNDWSVIASLQGPQGDQGPEGAQGVQGNPGPKGDDGAGIEIAGSVANYAALPDDLTSEDAGKGYLSQASGLLYIWDGESFPSQGGGVEFRGERGPEGPEGPEGPQGSQGIQGVQGDTGTQGDPGQRGATWYTGSGSPGTIPGSAAGDLYLNTSTGTVYKLS